MPHRDESSIAPEVRAAIRTLFEEDVAFNRVLGFRTISFNPDRPRVRFDMRPELIGNPIRKILHGGVIAAVLDATAGYALMLKIAREHAGEDIVSVLQRFRHVGTIDLRIDYLNPGRGEHFIATAEVLRQGSKIATVRMDLENDAGLRIAAGSTAFTVG